MQKGPQRWHVLVRYDEVATCIDELLFADVPDYSRHEPWKKGENKSAWQIPYVVTKNARMWAAIW